MTQDDLMSLLSAVDRNRILIALKDDSVALVISILHRHFLILKIDDMDYLPGDWEISQRCMLGTFIEQAKHTQTN